ncbi:hypothetical protein Taro_003504 [Colocasia esculenta]|uniref:Uncharacterized protein n=1 Tax=Colocasia esculenta TaxID=4460 RepID=A0A843THB8_COLES|nr:hypothetical protein [Colocasia esculenta]
MDGKVAWVGAESPESESGRRPATRLGGGSGQDPRSPVSRAGSAGVARLRPDSPNSADPSLRRDHGTAQTDLCLRSPEPPLPSPLPPPPPAGAATLAAAAAGAPRRVAAGRRRWRHCKPPPPPAPSSLSVLLSLFCEIRRDYDLPILVDDDEDDDDDPEFTAAARASRRSFAEEGHNDGEVMRGTINVITRIAMNMNERLDAVAEVLEPREVMGLGVLYQDMKIIHNHPNNNKEAKGKHNSNMGDMKANKGKQGMIGDMGLHIHPFLVPQNCHIQISALVVGLVIWAIFKLLDMVISSLRDNQEKVQANKQRHLEASKEDSKTLQILCLTLDIHSMEDMSMCHLFNLMR